MLPVSWRNCRIEGAKSGGPLSAERMEMEDELLLLASCAIGPEQPARMVYSLRAIPQSKTPGRPPQLNCFTVRREVIGKVSNFRWVIAGSKHCSTKSIYRPCSKSSSTYTAIAPDASCSIWSKEIPASFKHRSQRAQSSDVALGLSTSIRFISFLPTAAV
jgi:hypothetical protein